MNTRENCGICLGTGWVTYAFEDEWDIAHCSDCESESDFFAFTEKVAHAELEKSEDYFRLI